MLDNEERTFNIDSANCPLRTDMGQPMQYYRIKKEIITVAEADFTVDYNTVFFAILRPLKRNDMDQMMLLK